MKKLKIIFFLLFIFSHANAAFLRNIPITLKQPNGNVIHCFVTGDEFSKRVHDVNNFTILQKENGFYVYAIKIDDKVVPSDFLVGIEDPKQLLLEPGYEIGSTNLEVFKSSSRKSAMLAAENPTTGLVNSIVISIRFSDQSTTSKTLSDYESVFNSDNSRSLKYYFNEVSNSQLKISSSFFPSPNGQIITEYQDSHPRSYYLPYHEIINPIGYKSGDKGRETELLRNAIESVKNQIIQSNLNLDINNDNIIDNIIFILQGAHDAWGNILWPMTSSLESPITIGTKKIINYIKVPSDGLDASTLCYEVFHLLGAPDLYRYNDKNIIPVGCWDLMGGGDVNGHPLTYMKWRYGKWFNSIPEITTSGTYSLKPISKSPFACFKIPSPFSSSEFFMVEYRKKEGLIESQIHGLYDEGLIIYRINTNAVGNSGGPPDEVYIYRPNGTNNESGYLEKAAFAFNWDRISFSDITNPSCFLQGGEVGGIQISNISSIGDEITFTVSEISNLPIPTKFKATLNQNNINFSWEPPVNNTYNLQGYNIYQYGKTGPLNSTLITGLTFTTPLSETGEVVYNLTAVYDAGQSIPVMSKILYYPRDYVTVSDSLALVAFYNSTNGSNWTRNDNWLKTQVKLWYGIKVKKHRISEIWIDNNNIAGPLPEEIGQLTGLEQLVLQFNNLTGPIPKEIGYLTNLAFLELPNNKLTGQIPPEIGNLDKLISFTCMANQLSGPIPSQIGDLTNLWMLSLWGNKLSGAIPKEIGNLTNLEILSVEGNQLSGSVPQEITYLTSIKTLRLGNNLLTSIPDLSVLKNIDQLSLNDNLFIFRDLEPNMNVTINNRWDGSPGTFTYYPQKMLGEAQTIKVQQGLPYTLTVDCGGKYSFYQWFKNNQAVTQPQSSPDYTINVEKGDNGQFVCKVTNSIVKDLVLEYNPITIYGEIVTGIFPPTSNYENIKVYPNPTNEQIIIEGLSETKNSLISIYNMNGILIKEELVTGNQGKILIGKEKPGIYYLFINKRYKQAIKIIKQ